MSSQQQESPADWEKTHRDTKFTYAATAVVFRFGDAAAGRRLLTRVLHATRDVTSAKRRAQLVTHAVAATHARTQLHVLFCKRAENERDYWSGQVAFPGGKQDAEDASLLATAQREAFEEVGLRLDDAQPLVPGIVDADIDVGKPSDTGSNPRAPAVSPDAVDARPWLIVGQTGELRTYGPRTTQMRTSGHAFIANPFFRDGAEANVRMTLNEAEMSAFRWIPVSFFVSSTSPPHVSTLKVAAQCFPSIELPLSAPLDGACVDPRRSFLLWGLTLVLTVQMFARFGFADLCATIAETLNRSGIDEDFYRRFGKRSTLKWLREDATNEAHRAREIHDALAAQYNLVQLCDLDSDSNFDVVANELQQARARM